MQKRLIVIGGGAAGFFCAVNAARMNPALEVIIVEKSSKLLSKVKVSGGGRCNTTHACFEIPELVKRYPRGVNFLKKAFHWFNTNDTVKWFEERGVRLKTEGDGRMFPVTDNSQTIIDCLLREADKHRIEIVMNADVRQVTKPAGRFLLDLNDGRKFETDYLCIACGGFPKTLQFDWLKATGHSIESPVPSLFTFNMPGNTITQLMGVSVEEAVVKVAGTKLHEEGPLLITHWGMSGPVVLRTSAWGARILAEKNYRFNITVNWVPQYNEQDLRNEWSSLRNRLSAQVVHNKNPFGLPNRLWQYLLQQCGIGDDVKWGSLGSSQQNKLIQHLVSQSFEVNGKTTFKEEFVTCGGIKLSEIDVNTMQSKIMPGLFFAGEIMDVDGITGGFNFQHAWTSGFIAAKAIASNHTNR
ncbi:NAD(P)/FAD-dependent oxidoreductase [Danxiaibacter flavus]|uniref:NAD(P)/FAD-dependent oxidoreductase n=1 Tax=Danxiaibacter flavus TaxID=3049108 RepID=A0ABV3ZFB7_9BACT|nr:NAD(P)/FAD-dependent oxidoreductase [Chitinophagaceae bacterium DXS]